MGLVKIKKESNLFFLYFYLFCGIINNQRQVVFKMNKRANLYLNIYDFIIFILSVTSMGLCITLREVSFPTPVILRGISFIFGIIIV